MADMEDSLVMRRSKRSTAGNRMEAALAEFKAEEVGVDAEEDVDFMVEKDEEDAFESDFESTDDEAAQEDVDAAAEKVVRDDERKSRKAGGKSQLDRITAAAHVRHKATFNPQLYELETPRKTPSTAAKLKRRVMLGAVVDAETGEALPVESGSGSGGADKKTQRQSGRTHTVQNRVAHIQRLKKEVEEKKAATPKKVKTKAPPPTQDELLKRALEMEEGNIEEHTNYLATEEEKRKRARLIRTAVEGPLLRWVTKLEEVKVLVEPPAPPPPPPPAPAPALALTPIRPASSVGAPTTMTYQYGYSYPNIPGSSGPQPAAMYPSQAVPYYPYAMMQPHPSSSSGSLPATTSSQPTFIYHTYPTPAQALASAPPAATAPLAPPPEPEERIETVARCYVVHEVDQSEGTPKPLWKDTMAAMFGDHVKWEDLRAYTGKGRPMSRPVQTCSITGQPARYLDPRTGVPFANVQAFKTLTQILKHDFIWNESLGCYTSRADELEEHVLPDVDMEIAPTAAPATRKRAAKQGSITT